MQPAYFSATVIAMTLILSATILYLTRWLSKILENQTQTMTTMVNLMASKDLTTFQGLQRTTMELSSLSEPVEPIPALNDEAQAHALAEHYKAAGLDPNRAYAHDDADILSDFGGPEAFR